MLTTLTDKELVTKLQNGEKEAFAELFSRYSEKAFHLATRISRNQADAEEIIQEVFLNVYRKIDKFEGKSAFSSWLYRITVNSALMKLRKKSKATCVSLDEDIYNIESICLGGQENNRSKIAYLSTRHELRAKLQEAIESLPKEYKTIFILRDVDGLSNKEVSEIVDVSVPAVKSRLHRARILLKKRLLNYYNDYLNNDVIFEGDLKIAA